MNHNAYPTAPPYADQCFQLESDLAVQFLGACARHVLYILSRLVEPLSRDPAVDHLKTGLGLVVRNHVATCVQSNKGEVAAALNRANLGLLVTDKGQVLVRSLVVGLLTRPLKSLSPGKVTKPVANVILFGKLAHVRRGSNNRIHTASPA